MVLRSVARKDIPQVLELIKGLAEYEKDLAAVKNTVEKLEADIFDHEYCEAIVAEKKGVIIGFALFYTSYSTWKGPCLYLEDLFILPSERRHGVGSLLFDKLVEIAQDRKVSRMDWQVLDWNEMAINFYKKKNATLDSEWINGRLFFD